MAIINWIEVIQKAFDLREKKQMHVDEISQCIQVKSLIAQSMSTDDIKSRVNGSLANHVKNGKGSVFRKVKNKGKKSFQKGVYALKRQQKGEQLSFLDPLAGEVFEKNFRGKAGEHAFTSELLFLGYNASMMSVDVGMDVIAFKNNKTFHIQVKTSKQTEKGIHQASIEQTKFAYSNDIYYVVVLRHNHKNDFFIITSNDLRNLKRKGILGEGKNINIRLSQSAGKYFLAGKEPVQHHINDFKAIR